MQRAWMVLALIAVLGACGRKETVPNNTEAMPAETTMTAVTPMPMPAESTPAMAMTVTDPQIAAIVLAANSADSTAGALAKTKGTSAEVKKFGERMVTDHGASNRQVVALAKKLGATPEDNATSQKMRQDGDQNMAMLQGLSGSAFDKAYIDHEVAYHQTVLDALDHTLIPSAQNPELKALLEKTRPVVAAHLDSAKKIQSTMGMH